MAFIELGRKDSAMTASVSSKNKVWYPSLHVDNKSLPIEDKDVGKTITAIVKLKVTSCSKNISEKRKTESCGFDVLAINFNKKNTFDLSKHSTAEMDTLEEEEYDRQK